MKIRKNIELLENWAHDNDMESATNYLNKVVSIADFLSTSKNYLLQVIYFYVLERMDSTTLLREYYRILC